MRMLNREPSKIPLKTKFARYYTFEILYQYKYDMHVYMLFGYLPGNPIRKLLGQTERPLDAYDWARGLDCEVPDVTDAGKDVAKLYGWK